MLEFVKDSGTVMVEATARLCLTEDDRLVPEDDPEARWLYCIPGRMIPRAEAEKYGLLRPVAASGGQGAGREGARPASGPDMKAIRKWAEDNGLDVPARGRISETVVELYNEAREV